MTHGNYGTKPSWTRRAILGGGCIITAASVGGLWRGIDTGVVLPDQSPYDAWKAWAQTKSGDPSALIAAAILAASPHNTQPWLFKVTDNTILVYADENRHLGAFDPYRREMWHGLGAAIANIEIAAPARGFQADVQFLPNPNQPTLAALISLTPIAQATPPLVTMIDQRTTNRANYDRVRVPDDATLRSAEPSPMEGIEIQWVPANSVEASAFVVNTLAATQKIIADNTMSADSYRWFRHSPKQVAQYRDGPQALVAGIDPTFAKLSPLLPPLSAKESDGYWLSSTKRQLESAPIFGFILVANLYDRLTQLLAGAAWQRLHLGLTAVGLAAQPINQMIEWVDREKQLRATPTMETTLQTMTGRLDVRPTFAFRVGYPARAMPHSARRELKSVLLRQGL